MATATVNLLDKVQSLLNTHFMGSTAKLTGPSEDEKLSGFLLWAGFSERPMLQRQRDVGDLLRRELSPDERRSVSAIFTLTPDEYASMYDELAFSQE